MTYLSSSQKPLGLFIRCLFFTEYELAVHVSVFKNSVDSCHRVH